MESFAKSGEVVELSPNGIVVTKLVGAECLYVNKSWTDLTGFSDEQSLGDGWANAVAAESQKDFFEEINASTRDNRVGAATLTFTNGVKANAKIVHTAENLYLYISKI